MDVLLKHGGSIFDLFMEVYLVGCGVNKGGFVYIACACRRKKKKKKGKLCGKLYHFHNALWILAVILQFF